MQSATRLNALSVCNNNINDEGLQCLVEGITNCCSLKTLGLSYNRLITSAGLRSLAPFFQSDNCCMKELSLWGIHFGDDGAVALADGLIGNESLTTLQFDSPGITSRGWAAFSRLLCDASSVNNTYLSNHTLVKIGYGYYMRNTHSDIIEYLELNKALNCDADFCKILKNHPDFDIKPLFQWNLKRSRRSRRSTPRPKTTSRETALMFRSCTAAGYKPDLFRIFTRRTAVDCIGGEENKRIK